MSEMIDRIARVLYPQAFAHTNCGYSELDETYAFMREQQRRDARKVLEAMLEPTPEMIDAGHEVTGKWWDIQGSPLDIKRVKMKMRWQGMIREALKDNEV